MYQEGASYLIPLGFNFIKWIGDHILQPIIDALIDLLAPIIQEFLTLVGNLIYKLLSSVLFNIYVGLLSILDTVQSIFDRLSGANQVHGLDINGMHAQAYLTNFFINYGYIKKAFVGIMVVSLILCAIFTILAVTRAAGDMSGEFKVGQVMKHSIKALFTFFMIQFLVIATVDISNNMLTAVDTTLKYRNGADGSEGEVRMSNVIFTCSAINAANDKSGGIEKTGSTLHRYYSSSNTLYAEKAVFKDFMITKIDYVIGFVACGFMIFVMLSSVFFFIQRVFEIVLLYIVAPFYVASMPLDGGSRFAGWREMFVAKCIASYGTVVSIRLFFILLPIVMESSLSGPAGADSTMYYVKLLFVLGGALAVKKSQSVILQIVNPQAAQASDHAMTGFASGFMGAKGMTQGIGSAIRGKK